MDADVPGSPACLPIGVFAGASREHPARDGFVALARELPWAVCAGVALVVCGGLAAVVLATGSVLLGAFLGGSS